MTFASTRSCSTQSPLMRTPDQFAAQYPERGHFNVGVRTQPSNLSNHRMTPPPPEPRPRQGFKRCSESGRATELMSPPSSLEPPHRIFHTAAFFLTHLSSFHFTCSVSLQPARPHAVHTPHVPTLRVLLFHHPPDPSSIFATRLRSTGGEKGK